MSKMLTRVRKYPKEKRMHKRTEANERKIKLALEENRIKVCSDIDQKMIMVDW